MTVAVQNLLQQDVLVGYVDVGGVVVQVRCPRGKWAQWEGAVPGTLSPQTQQLFIPRRYVRVQDWDARTVLVQSPVAYIVTGSRALATGVGAITGTMPVTTSGAQIINGTAAGVGGVTGTLAAAIQSAGMASGTGSITGDLDEASGGGPPVTTGLVLQYDASQLGGLSDGDEVTALPDLSGNSHSATVASGSPTYKAAQLNGLPIVRFVAGDTFGLSCPQGTTSIIFAVMKTSSGTSGYQNFMDRAYSNNGPALYASGDGGATYSTGLYWDGPGGTLDIPYTGTGYPNSGYKIAAWEWDGTDVTLWEDGVSQVTASAKANVDTWVSIGYASAAQWYGDLGELLIYNGDLDDSDRAAVMSYLARKWGIPSPLGYCTLGGSFILG